MDYSTLNREVLATLPVYTLPAKYTLQEGSGNGCAGDPPGYPTYYTRNIYIGGNNPRSGPQMVVDAGDQLYVVQDENGFDKYKELLHKLWVPLPLDHPRVKLWIDNTYRHMRHCYQDVSNPEYGRPGMLIYPVPGYKLKSFEDDPRWSEEYRAVHKAEIEQFNADARAAAAKIAIPDNHKAVVCIREFYPDYQPELDKIANPAQVISSWWETEAEQPSEANCAKTQRWGHKHPFNGNWCQWCGRQY